VIFFEGGVFFEDALIDRIHKGVQQLHLSLSEYFIIPTKAGVARSGVVNKELSL